ncbi:MAG: hypothetical protein IH885_00055 [Myxococcales bacterium]|nr:hypothetical protein [Myxococcales bacterium]
MASLKIERLRIQRLVSTFVAVAVAFASLLIVAQPADASALFRLKRTWWFSQAGSWTDGEVIPQSGHFSTQYAKYYPPASASIGSDTPNPSFTGPASFIKNTTYTFMCGPGTFQCYVGYPKSSGYYSYYNAKGTWKKNNPNAPTTASTWRRRTVNDDYNATLMGWAQHTQMILTLMDMAVTRTVTVATHPPTVMYTLTTPTEGGCSVGNPGSVTHPAQCPGTTQFGGVYTDQSRGGSMMVTPGPNRFGGTLRFFGGPNEFYYQLIDINEPYYTSVYWENTPKSKQNGYLGQATIGQVAISYLPGIRFRLTNPSHVDRLVIGSTVPSSADCSPGSGTVRPPTNAGCKYYTRQVKYMGTDWPSTTGMAQAWQPFGNTNTVQTTTGYDNRTAAGLNGVVSVVAPSLSHAYTTIRATIPDNPIQMTWSSARMTKNTFTFMPEPTGVAMLAAGFVTLAGLYRLRRR